MALILRQSGINDYWWYNHLDQSKYIYRPVTSTGGTLDVTILANAGTGSGIGRGDNTTVASNAASLVIDGGTLTYSGTARSTDRLLTLGSNGGTINAFGTGAISFTNTNAIAYSGIGPRTLTLTGTNYWKQSICTINWKWGSDPVSVSKTGNGT